MVGFGLEMKQPARNEPGGLLGWVTIGEVPWSDYDDAVGTGIASRGIADLRAENFAYLFSCPCGSVGTRVPVGHCPLPVLEPVTRPEASCRVAPCPLVVSVPAARPEGSRNCVRVEIPSDLPVSALPVIRPLASWQIVREEPEALPCVTAEPVSLLIVDDAAKATFQQHLKSPPSKDAGKKAKKEWDERLEDLVAKLHYDGGVRVELRFDQLDYVLIARLQPDELVDHELTPTNPGVHPHRAGNARRIRPMTFMQNSSLQPMNHDHPMKNRNRIHSRPLRLHAVHDQRGHLRLQRVLHGPEGHD